MRRYWSSGSSARAGNKVTSKVTMSRHQNPFRFTGICVFEAERVKQGLLPVLRINRSLDCCRTASTENGGCVNPLHNTPGGVSPPVDKDLQEELSSAQKVCPGSGGAVFS